MEREKKGAETRDYCVANATVNVALRLLALDPKNLKSLRLRRDEVSRAYSEVAPA